VSRRVTRVCSGAPEQTQAAGEQLGQRLRSGQVVALIGELGAGKTCFVQGVMKGLGVESLVTSPTFVLVNEYRGRVPVHHVDAYRTERMTELLEIGLDEMLAGPGITVIEWGDKLVGLLPADAVMVAIAGLGDEPREIVIDEPAAEAGGPESVSDSGH
jgi:tRNA threonylcarbamoyladenosine biosynthesis protein TsaE